MIAEGRLDATPFATHRFPLADTMAAYDVFAAPEQTGALKVVLEAEAMAPRAKAVAEPIGATV